MFRARRPNRLRRTDRCYLRVRSATFFSLLCRRGFLPAVSSRPLSDGRPQLASCFSLTNGNFTVLHQSAVFTSFSLLSPVPEMSVWLQQQCGSHTGVCWSSLRVWHHSYHFCTLDEKMCSLWSGYCKFLGRDFSHTLFECTTPSVITVHVFPAVCLVLLLNSAPFLSPAVPADEMASFGCSRIRRTKRLPLSNTRTFSK